jgi:hypothetical protein
VHRLHIVNHRKVGGWQGTEHKTRAARFQDQPFTIGLQQNARVIRQGTTDIQQLPSGDRDLTRRVDLFDANFRDQLDFKICGGDSQLVAFCDPATGWRVSALSADARPHRSRPVPV